MLVVGFSSGVSSAMLDASFRSLQTEKNESLVTPLLRMLLITGWAQILYFAVCITTRTSELKCFCFIMQTMKESILI